MKTITIRHPDGNYINKWEEAQLLSGKVDVITGWWDHNEQQYVSEISVPDDYVPRSMDAVSKIVVDERIRLDNGDIVRVTGKLTCVVENFVV